jgi:hypothetical protein
VPALRLFGLSPLKPPVQAKEKPAPLGNTAMPPLFCPQLGCDILVVAVKLIGALIVAEVTELQALLSVTVTV